MNKEKYYYKKEISMSVTVIVLITIFIKILINNESFPASYSVKADMHPALQPVLPVWRL